MSDSIKKAIDWLNSLSPSDFNDGYFIGEIDDSIYDNLRGDGQPTLPFSSALHNAGFAIYAGDRDSFGWLTGVIEYNHGKLEGNVVVYG